MEGESREVGREKNSQKVGAVDLGLHGTTTAEKNHATSIKRAMHSMHVHANVHVHVCPKHGVH